MLCLLPATASCKDLVQKNQFPAEKPISWAKPAHFDFFIINCTVWSHILSTSGDALSDPLWVLLFWLGLGSSVFLFLLFPFLLLGVLFNGVCQGFMNHLKPSQKHQNEGVIEQPSMWQIQCQMLAVRSFWFYLGAPEGERENGQNAFIHNIGK